MDNTSDKFNHAETLIEELRERMHNLPGPAVSVSQQSQQSQQSVEIAWALPPQELIPKWHCFVGDIVHNLRSSLDHLACAMVLEGGGKVTNSIYFPLAESEAAFEKRIVNGCLLGARASDINVVRQLKPYRGGADRLFQLHRLDNIDKHRRILVVPPNMLVMSFPFGADQRGGLGIGLQFAEEPVAGEDVLTVLCEMRDAVSGVWDAVLAQPGPASK